MDHQSQPSPQSPQDEETLSAAMTIDQSDKSGPVAKPVKPLSDKQKRTIDTVFADNIGQKDKPTIAFVRNKMCTNTALRTLAMFKPRVKQVVNYINCASSPTKNPKELPTNKNKPSMWLEDLETASTDFRSRQYWDDDDSEIMEKRFQEFITCPSKDVIRTTFFTYDDLHDIMQQCSFPV